MKNTIHCQSCNMPISKIIEKGIEKNGSFSEEYCRYCYRDGAFVNPDLTLGEMRSIITIQLQRTHLSSREADSILNSLPCANRWKKMNKDI